MELECIAIYNNSVCTCTVATVCSESMTVVLEGEKQLLLHPHLQHHLPNARPIGENVPFTAISFTDMITAWHGMSVQQSG